MSNKSLSDLKHLQYKGFGMACANSYANGNEFIFVIFLRRDGK